MNEWVHLLIAECLDKNLTREEIFNFLLSEGFDEEFIYSLKNNTDEKFLFIKEKKEKTAKNLFHNCVSCGFQLKKNIDEILYCDICDLNFPELKNHHQEYTYKGFKNKTHWINVCKNNGIDKNKALTLYRRHFKYIPTGYMINYRFYLLKLLELTNDSDVKKIKLFNNNTMNKYNKLWNKIISENSIIISESNF